MKNKVPKISSIIFLVIAAIVIVGYFIFFKGLRTRTIVEEKIIISDEYRLPYFDFGEGENNFILLPGSSMHLKVRLQLKV